jgi:thiamine biosynthesis lipoprotein
MQKNDVIIGGTSVHRKVLKLMGNRFEFTVCAADSSWAFQCIEKAIDEVRRIESLLTTFDDKSQTNRVNRNAGISPVKVDKEVFDLLTRCRKISDLTQGAFDITYGSTDKKLWNFDQSMTSLPSPAIAKQLVHLVNYRNVVLNESDGTVFLKQKGMRIGFGGIGKGYAADRAKQVLKNCGVVSGVVNAAGDLTAWGRQPDGKPWTIGIADPEATRHVFSTLEITDSSVATSGNYEKFILVNGKKYSHTIDPKTGMPVTGIQSVTVLAPNAELADAMATPVMIMGRKAGLHMINQVKGLACIIVDDDHIIHTTQNIHLSRS